MLYPHLPNLPVRDALSYIEQAKINDVDAATLLGVTRQSLHNWRRGVTAPSSSSQARVSVLAYKALRGLRDGLLPLNTTLNRGERLVSYVRILIEDRNSKPLTDYSADELLCTPSPEPQAQ